MKSQKIQTVEFILVECADYPFFTKGIGWWSDEWPEEVVKECGETEGYDVSYADYYTRLTDNFIKTKNLEAVMYYNDEVFQT